MDIDDPQQKGVCRRAQHQRKVFPLRKKRPGEVPLGFGPDRGRVRKKRTTKDANDVEELGGGSVALHLPAVLLPSDEPTGRRGHRQKKRGLVDYPSPQETLFSQLNLSVFY